MKQHQPKGYMCSACKNKASDCSKLPFSEMPIMFVHDGVKIVRCTEFKSDQP